jgi:hypothetical protein
MFHVWFEDAPNKNDILLKIHDYFGYLMPVFGMTLLLMEVWLYRHLLIEPEKVR